jgi:hypothetical protein
VVFSCGEKYMARPAISKDPLPQAGESLRERLDDVVDLTIVRWGAVVLVGVV